MQNCAARFAAESIQALPCAVPRAAAAPSSMWLRTGPKAPVPALPTPTTSHPPRVRCNCTKTKTPKTPLSFYRFSQTTPPYFAPPCMDARPAAFPACFHHSGRAVQKNGQLKRIAPSALRCSPFSNGFTPRTARKQKMRPVPQKRMETHDLRCSDCRCRPGRHFYSS